MMRPGADVRVYLCVSPVDGRKQATGLALLIEQSLGRDVFEPALYVFANRRKDRVRIVYWERNGLCKPSEKYPRQRI
jgi:transposase